MQRATKRKPAGESLNEILSLMAENKLDDAVARARKASKKAPDDANILTALGGALLKQGQLTDALQAFDRVTELAPEAAESWHNRGNALRKLGRLDEALEAYRRAIAMRPDFPEALCAAGDAAWAGHYRDEAIACYRRASALQVERIDLQLVLARMLRYHGQPEAARDIAHELQARHPGNSAITLELACALRACRDFGSAARLLDQLLAENPRYEEALVENMALAEAIQDEGRLEQAYLRYLQVKPHSGEALFNLGALHMRKGRYSTALAYFDEARQQGLISPLLDQNTAHTLANLGQVDEALTIYDTLELDKQRDIVQITHIALLRAKMCDWKALNTLRQDVIEPALAWDGNSLPPLPFPLLVSSTDLSEPEILTLGQHFAHHVSRDITPTFNFEQRTAKPRIRIGYVSADFKNHATSHLMLGLFSRHDRSQFEVYAYSLAASDDSLYSGRIRQDVDAFIDISLLDNQAAAQRIYQDEIDLLIDLKGYTRDARTEIFAYRPAPVQIAWLGYPGSMGADFIDYIITDRVVTPPERQPYYSEKFAFMPHCYQVNDSEQVIAAQLPTRAECGLPENAFVFCCFCVHFKLEPEIFGVWLRLLAAVPNSVLWLIDGTETAKTVLREAAHSHGIDPERLVFAPMQPKDQHLARHCHADLFLDTYYCNAHTTASDALWAGLPVITAPRDTFASRVCASLLHAIELPELICDSLASYEALALHYAQNPKALKALKKKLSKKRLSAPLFDTERFARDFEHLLKDIWQQHAPAQPTASFDSALALYQQGEHAAAEQMARGALAAEPRRADGWNLLGAILRQRKAMDEAVQAYTRSIETDPGFADAYNNLANCLKDLGRNAEAIEHYKRALALKPDYPAAWDNLGGTLHADGQYTAAKAAFLEALRLKPDYADAYWNLSLCLLQLGEFRPAWEAYEWRFARGLPAPREYNRPKWTGESLQGKTLLVTSEQGLGDTLQFARFLNPVIERGACIVLEVQVGLKPLFKHMPGISALIEQGEQPPNFDYHCSLLSLPHILGSEDPCCGPYLPRPDAVLQQHWHTRLAALPGPKVGLVWAGNPNVKNDRERSPRLAPLQALWRLSHIQFVILQQGDGRRDLEGLTLPPNVHDFAADVRDFADTAAIMCGCDVVLSSDTSTAHLAGALGAKLWAMLPHVADWRWGRDGQTPWYPNARLFQQPHHGDWAGAMAEVASALQDEFPAASATLEQAFEAWQQQSPQARALCRAALQQAPERVELWTLWGILLKQSGQEESAQLAYQKAIQIDPNYPHPHQNLGNLFRARGDWEQAVRYYRQALALNADPAPLFNNLADCERQLKHYDLALDYIQQAIERAPTQPDHWVGLGNLHADRRDYEASISAYSHALQLAPGYLDAHYNLGVALQLQDRHTDALPHYDTVLGQQPGHLRARYNRGIALQKLQRLDEAESDYQIVMEQDPRHFGARFNLATVFNYRNKIEQALATYRQALALKPDDLNARTEIAHLSQKLCDWSELPRLREQVVLPAVQGAPESAVPSPFPFVVMSTPISEAELHRIAQHHARHLSRYIVPLPQQAAHAPRPRLRIGYLSADYHNHATAHLTLGLFKRHDRERFEVFAYSLGPDDGSHYRDRIRAEVDSFVDISTLTPLDAARLIQQDEIDVLIDLKGYTRDAQPEVLAYRPAPVQIAWLGFPGGMGADFVDYVITDRIVTPPELQLHYTEKFAYMPHCYQVNDREQAIADWAPTRAECGLPEQGFVFCCFCALYKIEPEVFGVWMRLLKAVPGSVLWLIDGYDTAKQHLREAARIQGVDPDRLVFAPSLPKDQHLARHILADIFLDTYYCNAHTTASDALWAGLPVITAPRDTFASRVCASLLHAIELPELVCNSLADYEALALRYAQQPAQLAALKTKLQQQRLQAPLFDTDRFVADLEVLLQELSPAANDMDTPRETHT